MSNPLLTEHALRAQGRDGGRQRTPARGPHLCRAVKVVAAHTGTRRGHTSPPKGHRERRTLGISVTRLDEERASLTAIQKHQTNPDSGAPCGVTGLKAPEVPRTSSSGENEGFLQMQEI